MARKKKYKNGIDAIINEYVAKPINEIITVLEDNIKIFLELDIKKDKQTEALGAICNMIKASADGVINVLEAFVSTYEKFSKQPDPDLTKIVNKLKTDVVELYSKLFKRDLSPSQALSVINEMLVCLKQESIINDMVGVSISRWNNAFQKNLENLEQYNRNKNIYSKSSDSRIVGNGKLSVGQSPSVSISIKTGIADKLFDKLELHFEKSSLTELKKILTSGCNSPEKLLFKGNGNKLSDTFKQLFESNLISGCKKTDLIKWIVINFKYLNKGAFADFKEDSVEKIISRKGYPCKKPLISIKNGVIT